MSKIKSIHGREIFDSRGNPTIEVDVVTANGNLGRACVPSGASTGQLEALELRDGDKSRFLGKGVTNAVKNVNEKIGSKLIGKEVTAQRELDDAMICLDGTKNKSELGANAILGVSLAAARAAALDENKSLFRYMRENLSAPTFVKENPVLPAPMMNIINGGEHASNNLDIQEFMIIPHLKGLPFKENLRAGVEIFHNLKKVLHDKGYSTNVGDEGGFAPDLKSHEEALDLILTSIEKAGYKPEIDISLCLDCASSEYYRDGKYHVQGKTLSGDEKVKYLEGLVQNYPIYSIEDGLAEDDHESWKNITAVLGNKIKLIGDDLFVTNKEIFKTGIQNQEANAILVKVNQIGSLTETFEAMGLGFEHNYLSVASHRSGETADHFIADLAVATSCGHIKTGSASRSDRMEKYNQLLRIEAELGDEARYYEIK